MALSAKLWMSESWCVPGCRPQAGAGEGAGAGGGQRGPRGDAALLAHHQHRTRHQHRPRRLPLPRRPRLQGALHVRPPSLLPRCHRVNPGTHSAGILGRGFAALLMPVETQNTWHRFTSTAAEAAVLQETGSSVLPQSASACWLLLSLCILHCRRSGAGWSCMIILGLVRQCLLGLLLLMANYECLK